MNCAADSLHICDTKLTFRDEGMFKTKYSLNFDQKYFCHRPFFDFEKKSKHWDLFQFFFLFTNLFNIFLWDLFQTFWYFVQQNFKQNYDIFFNRISNFFRVSKCSRFRDSSNSHPSLNSSDSVCDSIYCYSSAMPEKYLKWKTINNVFSNSV